MKLVKGRTLAALLVDRKSLRDGQRRLLAVFEQVCRTMAYAHSRRVVHRDLKPSNVMLGAFGEVQVVDWGLAKVLGREDVPSVRPVATDAPEISLIATVRSGSAGSGSLAGSVLGTPGYMSPEQAIGRVEDVDERTDVFALGAILCEILTGQPPFTGEARDQIVLAARANLDDASERLAKCGADPEIVAVALKCLAADRAARFQDAGVVADAVTAHLSGIEASARRAEVAAAVARAKAEEEKISAARERSTAVAAKSAHRRTIALAAVALTGVAAGIVVWRREAAGESERVTRSIAAVSTALADANAKRGAKDLVGALAAAKNAVALAKTGEVDAETAARTAQLLADVEAEDRAAADAAARAAKFETLFDRLAKAHDDWTSDADRAQSAAEHAAAFGDCGIDIEAGDVETSASVIRSSPRAADVVPELELFAWKLEALGKSAPDVVARVRRIRQIARAADPDPWRAKFRDARDRGDAESIRALATQADVSKLPEPDVVLLGIGLSTKDLDAKRGRELFRAAVRRRPDDWLAQLLLSLSEAYVDAADRDPDEGCAAAFAGLAVRPPTLRTWLSLGEALNDGRDPESVRAAFDEAQRIEPGQYRALAGIAVALYQSGNKAGANEALDRATEAVEAAVKNGKELGYPSWPYLCRGKILGAAGDHAGAAAALRRAVELAPTIAQNRDVLAHTLVLLKDYDGAAVQARESIRLAPNSATGYQKLFEALSDSAKTDADALLVETARAVELFPKDVYVRNWHAMALQRKADEILDEHGADAAKPVFASAIEECRRCLALEPRQGFLHDNLSVFLVDAHAEHAEAVAEARASLRLGSLPAVAHYTLGRALYDDGQPEAAAAEFEESGRPGSSADLEIYLYLCLSAQGDAVPELAHARAAVALAPDLWRCHDVLGCALIDWSDAGEGDGWAEALAELRRAQDLYAKARRRSADVVKDVDELIATCERVLDPQFPDRVRRGMTPASRKDAADIVFACSNPKSNVPGVRYAVDALAADPRIGDEESLSLRVNGAGISVQAADGKGEGASALDAATRDAWRRRALEWLREAFAAYAARIVGDDPSKAMLARREFLAWKKGPDLAPVRTSEGLAKLGVDDRVAWERLWADVDRALRSWSTRRK
jgi:serine/threonine-protein kinase